MQYTLITSSGKIMQFYLRAVAELYQTIYGGVVVDGTVVRDRKTGEYYDPKARFDEMMNKPEIVAVFKRLAVR